MPTEEPSEVARNSVSTSENIPLTMMKKKTVDAAMDRISKLPEPILQKILSLLILAKDAARLSTLSKTLHSAWSSLSCLNFGDDFFYHEGSDNRWILSENIPELVNVVDQALAKRQKQKISIQKFWLTVPSCHWSSYVHNWIKTLVALNIKVLILSIENSDDGSNTLPEEIFAAKELNVLDLLGFKLELPHDGIKFSSLRKLRLCNTFLDEHFIRAVCESCSCLEELSLIKFHGLTRLQIAGTLPKLRRVWLSCPSQFRMVDIVAPNLEELNITSFFWMLGVIEITACKALKSLSLRRVGVTDKWLEDLLPNLPNLEDLRLIIWKYLMEMKISNDRLKHLVVSGCFHLISVQLDTPNLTSFSYTAYSHYLPTLKLMKSSVNSLEVEADIYKLKQFLRSFEQWKAVKLWCGTDEVIVLPEDLEGTLPKFIIHEDDEACSASLPLKRWRQEFEEGNWEDYTRIQEEELRYYLFDKCRYSGDD